MLVISIVVIIVIVIIIVSGSGCCCIHSIVTHVLSLVTFLMYRTDRGMSEDIKVKHSERHISFS